MLEKIFRYVYGYAVFEIDGNANRFFNIAARSGIELWGFSIDKRSKKKTAAIKASKYKRLIKIKRKCGLKLRLRKKRGLPFHTLKVMRRKGLVIGLVLSVAVFIFFSNFFWGIRVTGIDKLTETAVLNAARECGVYEGAKKGSFDAEIAADEIAGMIEGISWVSVNTDGCTVEIAIKESEIKPPIIDDNNPSNIISAKAGKIVSIEAQSGQPMVKIGDSVEEGDTLIAGIYAEQRKENDYSERELITVVGAARGTVVAETFREFSVQVSENLVEEVPTGKEKINTKLIFFGLEIPLGINTTPKEETKLFSQKKDVFALGVKLPIGIKQDIYEFVETQQRIMNEDEIKEKALLKLREFQKASMPADSKIIDEKLEYTIGEGVCVLTAKSRCEEEIGIYEKFS